VRGRQDHVYNGEPADVMLAHIKDFNQMTERKGYGLAACTTDKVVFHTDVGDIVSLLALNQSANGGESLISSSWRVYNELAKSRPDLIRTLTEDWAIDGYESEREADSCTDLVLNADSTTHISHTRNDLCSIINLLRMVSQKG